MAQPGNPPTGNPCLSASGEESASDQSLSLLGMDDYLLVPLLPKLAATRVYISRQYILKISVAALRVTTSQEVHYDDDDSSFFATVQIHVPAHENIPQFKTTVFAGNNCQTMDAALESASVCALLYMQKANILIIDDLNLPELAKCRKDVVRAKSWSDIFEHETVKLNKKVGSLERELASLKEDFDQQSNSPQLMMMPSNEAYAKDDSIQQAMPAPPTKEEIIELIPIANEVATPPYEHDCADVFRVAKKAKGHNNDEDPLFSTSTSNDTFSSRVLPKTANLGARRALFTSKKKGMDA